MHQVFLTPLDALLLNPLLTLLSLIPLTPAGWGIQEAGIVIVFAAMGISAAIATSFALLTRLLEVAFDLFGTRELLRKPIKNEHLFSFYNTISGDIDEKAYNSDLLVQQYFQRRKTDAVRDSLGVKAGDIVVDIGCGSGVQLQEIGRTGYALAVGIDVSLNAALHGQKKAIKNTDFIIADAQHLPVKASCVDKIICAEIIEHVKEPDHLITEIARVLKDGGEVVITTPNDRSVWGMYEFFWDLFGRGRNYKETHLRFFSESGLRSYFPAFSECSTRTLFFISPLFALTNSRRLLAIGIRLDRVFEQRGLGVSLLLHARK
jgi:ubiquinone/menaquinone biosynthesis C-methylase UbiE